jgi:hypothetical protein
VRQRRFRRECRAHELARRERLSARIEIADAQADTIAREMI